MGDPAGNEDPDSDRLAGRSPCKCEGGPVEFVLLIGKVNVVCLGLVRHFTG